MDLTRTYRTDLFDALAGRAAEPIWGAGVLAMFPGPSYETPAEVRMARTLGARVVGMSTVPEAVWARYLGLDVIALARVVNPAAGVSARPSCHAEVVAEAPIRGRAGARVDPSGGGVWRDSRADEQAREDG